MAIALTPEEADHVRQNNKVKAIVLIQRRTNLGLKEAYDMVNGWDWKTLTTDAPPCPHCGGTGRMSV